VSTNILLDDDIRRLFEDNPDLEGRGLDKFEFAVAAFSNIKHLNGLEFDDLISGIMGSGGDEGIDLCYIFYNGTLISENDYAIEKIGKGEGAEYKVSLSELIKLNRDSNVKVKFFQAKKVSGFETEGFKKTKEGFEEIFDLNLSPAKLEKVGANKHFIEKAILIRHLFRKARQEKSGFSCEIFYATAANHKEISGKIKHEEKKLKEKALIPVEVYFWNAQDLIDLNSSSSESIEVKFNTPPIEIKERHVTTSGYSGFVNGNDLVRCLMAEDGSFKSYMTDGNVRFFLGEDVKINSQIIETAKDERKAEIFWAMNNGLTVLGDEIANLGGSEYSIENPQIVNGCQTIHCLYHAYIERGGLPSALKVFVKLIYTESQDAQIDIISATNSQNPVKSASLKANDSVQRNIEAHLYSKGIYYERRENYYKAKGLTGNKVIGLVRLTQIAHSVINQESVLAVNDTSKLFEDEQKYKRIFNPNSDLDVYLFSAILYQKIWSLKNSDQRNNEYVYVERELISKGGFLLLNVMSRVILSNSSYKEGDEVKKDVFIDRINVDNASKKNPFVKRKKSAFKLLEDDNFMRKAYELSRGIYIKAAKVYSEKTSKSQLNLLKHRAFDKDYLLPAIESCDILLNPKP